jgi:hypothetical protein
MMKHQLAGKSILELGYIERLDDSNSRFLLRDFESNITRTNLDLSNGVDFAWDLHQPLPTESPLTQFDIVICNAVFEHVRYPWVASKNLENSLALHGLLFWSTPWHQRIHGYPSDYWRFTPEGVKSLFSNIVWLEAFYEVWTNDPLSSVLVPWDETKKDSAIGLGGKGLRELARVKQAALGSLNDKYADDAVYSSLAGSVSFQVMPRSSFIMVGRKECG